MIKEIEKIEEINGVDSPLIPRIFSAFKYKSGSDNAWKQVDGDGKIVAYLSSVDGNITLITTENTDFEEIKEFLGFCGSSFVVSDVPLTSSAKSYAFFKYVGTENFGMNFDYYCLENSSTVNQYKNFYSLIFADVQGDFDSWYCDFSKKIVNGDAKAVCLKQEGNLISIATAPMIYKNKAIISGVYTLQNYRKQGFSRATIYKLIEEFKKDNVTEVYLWCEKSLEDFYKKIGFTKIGNVYIETEF